MSQPRSTQDACAASAPPGALGAWIAACLADGVVLPDTPLPLELAANEGVLPWLAWRVQDAGKLVELPERQQAGLRDSLRRWALMHLDCEAELERLARSSAERSLRLVVFKGHSVARTLYPHPACRPTSDFDLLVDPAQVGAARDWLAALGYAPLQAFVGTVWLGAQAWTSSSKGNARFHVDLHWDYSNRMYFRNRVPFEDLWSASRETPCGGATLRVPCPVDELVLACVHLAAHDPGARLQWRWYLDVYLLLSALGPGDIPALLQRAGQARALEACLEFGQRAAEMGERGRAEPALAALRAAARPQRARAYARTLRWRAWDLAAYWLRLPPGQKIAFFGDMLRWIRVR